MTKEELNDIIQHSEVSRVQFKERIDDNYKIGTVLVAFSNTRGGCLVIGVKDKTGEMNPLSYEEVQDTTEKLSNIATQNVDPHIGIETETVKVDGGSIVVVTVSEGINKPYKDNKGIIWAKQGSRQGFNHRTFNHHTHYKRTLESRHMARNISLRVSRLWRCKKDSSNRNELGMRKEEPVELGMRKEE